MRKVTKSWLIGSAVIFALIAVPIGLLIERDHQQTRQHSPWSEVPQRAEAVDHSDLFPQTAFNTGPEVTAACLQCHEQSGEQVIHTKHWTWQSQPVDVEGREQPVAIGKKNVINNFCIGVQGNWESCTACHTGYGWKNEAFDFANQANVDCVVCHDQTGTYKKGKQGLPVKGVDLLAVAQSVGRPTRSNCGSCHFNGGGGDAVKHGDLDQSLKFPEESLDVHMGRYDFACVDCHQTEDHNIAGRSITVSLDNHNQVYCQDCHQQQVHADERITRHLDSVACQTCHIPEVARKQPTKISWDWSTSGDDSIKEEPHHYLKIKGSFVYEDNLQPSYLWFNGLADRYLLGDPINPNSITAINQPKGSIRDPKAKIWPFKVHIAKQPYDSKLRHLLQPKTVGKDGYWSHFDWDKALALGAAFAGIEYSGSYDFATTSMFWPQTHMVAPKDDALQCLDCHGETSRLDWQDLGYSGDPLKWGTAPRQSEMTVQEANYEH
ncbi:tetrathionate reductase family octaheme c-type cytochrome [Vibrio hangzhouensis]|uniref:tetrathionate reductase family octaheme c-type cytochrome n=1 Tax=Vibrio hangzhouensis TaxID=462991 RepID=UPI001C956091|nr:tetrathionate reductase family octaheme c-type cytochrome [Vibrio hangzhouensis]MBY6196054.1 tetrathionate reductase family octaheme c-type cytochrome [Vibrio hangzhouensis]